MISNFSRVTFVFLKKTTICFLFLQDRHFDCWSHILSLLLSRRVHAGVFSLPLSPIIKDICSPEVNNQRLQVPQVEGLTARASLPPSAAAFGGIFENINKRHVWLTNNRWRTTAQRPARQLEYQGTDSRCVNMWKTRVGINKLKKSCLRVVLDVWRRLSDIAITCLGECQGLSCPSMDVDLRRCLDVLLPFYVCRTKLYTHKHQNCMCVPWTFDSTIMLAF